jgi:hypothetical protein
MGDGKREERRRRERERERGKRREGAGRERGKGGSRGRGEREVQTNAGRSIDKSISIRGGTRTRPAIRSKEGGRILAGAEGETGTHVYAFIQTTPVSEFARVVG